jgi:hypothetical protein
MPDVLQGRSVIGDVVKRFRLAVAVLMIHSTAACRAERGRHVVQVLCGAVWHPAGRGIRLYSGDKVFIPANAAQQSIGFIAQHLEAANYGLCERLGSPRRNRSSKDAVPDTVKAAWPKDTLVTRLRASLAFCDSAVIEVER